MWFTNDVMSSIEKFADKNGLPVAEAVRILMDAYVRQAEGQVVYTEEKTRFTFNVNRQSARAFRARARNSRLTHSEAIRRALEGRP